MTPSQKTPTFLIKSLLLYLFDSCVGDLTLYTSLCEVYRKTKKSIRQDFESELWSIFEKSLVSHTQPTLMIIDGLDHFEGGVQTTELLRKRLRDVAVQRESLRCIILVRPNLGKQLDGIFDYSLDAHVIREEIRKFVQRSVTVTFSSFSQLDRDNLIRRIFERKFETFLEVKLLIRFLGVESSYTAVLQKLGNTPRSLNGILDCLILQLDFTQQQIASVLSWLLVGERHCTVLELEKLTGLNIQDICFYASSSAGQRINLDKSIVEIQQGRVEFIHPLFKQRLEELCFLGRIALTIKQAYMTAMIQSLSYIKSCLPTDIEPTFREMSLKKQTFICKKLDKDVLFKHCVTSYPGYFRKLQDRRTDTSRAAILSDMRKILPDSSLLALAESTFWSSSKNVIQLEQSLLQVLELRKSVFGERSCSVVQNLASIAHLQTKNKSFHEALLTLFEAWTLCKNLYGEASSITKDCAEVYCETVLEYKQTQEYKTSREAETVFRFLWEALRLELGDTHEKALQYGQDVAQLCIEMRRLDQAVTILRSLHRACLDCLGVLNDRTSTIADTLITVLEEQSDREEEIERLREAISDASMHSTEPWQPRRIKNTLQLVDIYENRLLWSQAESRIVQYLETLNSVIVTSHDGTDISVLVACGDLTYRLSRFLSARSRFEEATKTLISFSQHFEHVSISATRLLPSGAASEFTKFRIIADEMIALGATASAQVILMKLRACYMEENDTRSKEALLVSLSLVRCFRLDLNKEDAEAMLQNLYDMLLGDDNRSKPLGTNDLSVLIQLALFHKQSGKLSDAIKICTRTLILEWIPILGAGSFDIDVGAQKPQELIHIAMILVATYQLSDREDQSYSIVDRLRQIMFVRLATWNTAKISEADWFSKTYEDLGLSNEAIIFWKELRARCVASLPRYHKFSLRVAYHLARLCHKLNDTGDEGTLIDIIDDLGHEHSHDCSKLRLDAITALCELFEHQHKYGELRKWYLTLWSSFLNQRGQGGVSGKQGLEIFQKYALVLVKLGETSGAIRVARELRAVLIAEYGPSDFFSVKAAVELALLLEKGAATREEAVSIYEEICKIPINGALADQKTIIGIVRTARDRLAELLSTQPDLAHRAEQIFMQEWEEARKVIGHSSDQTLASLARLISFYQKYQSRKYTNMALERIEVTIRGILDHEHNLHRLYSSAEAIAKLYIDLNARDSAFSLLSTIRADFSTQQSVGFLREKSWVDRRWSVFAATLEATLRNKVSSALFTDIISDLLTETSLYESWQRVLKSKTMLEVKLSVGGQLIALLSKKGRQAELVLIKDELWQEFRRELSPESPKSGGIWKLFGACIADLSRERSLVTLLETAINVVENLGRTGSYQQALELAGWMKGHVSGRGGFTGQDLGSLGIRLSICLLDVSNSVEDRDILESLQRLSTKVLSEAFAGRTGSGFEFGDLTIKHINMFIKVLSIQQDYGAIEVG